MSNFDDLYQLGQSLWYDNIQRSQLSDGKLKEMVEQGWIKGVTSNPSIFQKSIATSTDYDETLKPLAWSGVKSEGIFWQLAVEDIQKAADILFTTYEKTKKVDGYVSLEVSPLFARDTNATIQQAQELWDRVNRPNLMIKIPATREGIPAIRKVITMGINVNVTLIFSIDRYREVMDAFISGLEDRVNAGEEIDSIHSVASFFVSRIDSRIDDLLEKKAASGELSSSDLIQLSGKAAIANARLAYQQFENLFTSYRFQDLKAKGGNLQRPLWASTSTKNPNYRDVIYIEELIGKNTVNTTPPATLDAFADHGEVHENIHNDLDQATQVLSDLERHGISIFEVTTALEKEGVLAFTDAFTSLLITIEKRRIAAVAELGNLFNPVAEKVAELKKSEFISRFYNKDYSLWATDEDAKLEIQNRMNWVNAPVQNQKLVKELDGFLKETSERGIEQVVVLGMGGSSLAPEVYRLIHGLGTSNGVSGLDLIVLDSTDPQEVKEIQEKYPAAKTLYIVASKSGSTGEINAFFDFFWDRASIELGEKAGDHFIAITDPGTNLEKKAKDKGFWRIFSGDPQVGGRFSALTAFGLVPAALIGMDLDHLLKNAEWLARYCKPEQAAEANPGLVLGAFIGVSAVMGKNKLTILIDDDWLSFGNWLEQLIAESSGKIGKGITPIVNEPELPANEYKSDRIFVYIRQNGQKQEFVDRLRISGQSVLVIDVKDAYDLGAQFYLWEVATPVACSILKVNVFDQPDVQDAKLRTLQSLEEFKQTGKLIEIEAGLIMDGVCLYTEPQTKLRKMGSLLDTIISFISDHSRVGDYIALNAFLPRNPENVIILQNLREKILKRLRVATTLGFGPRFLHSTGQLHKGGSDEGLFIVITARRQEDVEIPGQGVTFGIMQRAQALGDMSALRTRNRRMLWIDLPTPDCELLN